MQKNKNTETIKTDAFPSEVVNLTASLLGNVICHTAPSWAYPDSNSIVLLTEELVDHIEKMYNNTDWDSVDYASINLPDDIFAGDMDVDAFREYIGEHIVISRFGESWDDILDYSVFVPGVTIDFPDRMIDMAVDDMDYLRNNETFLWYVLENALLAIRAKLADGIPEKDLKRLLEREFGVRGISPSSPGRKGAANAAE